MGAAHLSDNEQQQGTTGRKYSNSEATLVNGQRDDQTVGQWQMSAP